MNRLEGALSMLLLLCLPGCATEALWAGEDFRPGVVWEEEVADLGIELAPDQAVAGALAVAAQRVDGHRMPQASGVQQSRSWWRFVPEEKADEAMALLESVDGFAVHRATVEVRRDFMDGGIQCSDVDLRLDVAVDWAAVATRVDEARLPAATSQVLSRPRRNDLFGSDAVDGAWPELLTRCAERLPGIDLTPLFADAGHAELETWAWVDEDLRSVVDRQKVEALCGADLDDKALPLEERLEKLASLRLLVVAVTGTTRATFSLRPDCVWLLGGMTNDGRGRCMHQSRWHARLLAEPLAVGLERPPGTVAGTMRMRSFTGGYANDVAPRVAARVLATPFAVAWDALLVVLVEYPLCKLAPYMGRKGVGGGR